jgi:putative spermidine/putrescine transport system substrate-binding protein
MVERDEGVERSGGMAYDRRRFLRQAGLGVAGIAGGVLLDAASSSASPLTSAASRRVATAPPMLPPGLLAAAKQEGAINLIALPPTWANYGAVGQSGTLIGEFYANYKITCNSTAPDDSSAQELAAIKTDKGTSKEPDVVDVSPAIAVEGAQGNYFQPYKVQTWDDIPASMKDPNGDYYGDYYGVISFGCNTKVVKNPPKSWADLEKPEYAGQVAIDGNPGSAGDAFAAVFSAALAMGGSLDNIMPGLEYFEHLRKIGNWNSIDCYPANIVSGATPIAIVWDYLNLGYRKSYPSINYQVNIPTTGRYGGYYCQAISASAPHPKAAELWEEFVYSDEGQLAYLKGYAHPARYEAMAKAGKIPASLANLLPPASEYTNVHFPTVAQISKAAAIVVKNWDSMVGGS